MERGGSLGAKQNKEMAPKLHRGPNMGPLDFGSLRLAATTEDHRLWPRYADVDRSPTSRAKQGRPTRFRERLGAHIYMLSKLLVVKSAKSAKSWWQTGNV